MTILYLVRHGETELNKAGVYYGWTDCDLSQAGYKQAEELSNILSNKNFDFVFSSPLKRALKTALIVSNKHVNSINIDDRLKELNFGHWEGRHFSDIQRQDKENWEKWCNGWKKAAPPYGESFSQMYSRVNDFVECLLDNYSDKTILIVSHQGCLRIMAAILMKLGQEGYWSFTFEHGRFSQLELDGDCCIIRKINC